MAQGARLTARAATAAVTAALALGGCALPQAPAPVGPPPVGAAPLPVAPSGAWVWMPQLESAGTRLRASLFGSGAEV
ncbi:MAG TPA: hypothetical protein PKA20_30480, partial [Burkholderiaceae bacterium]|nr:hypothetical protein [Burkholderiaceae bacterium]